MRLTDTAFAFCLTSSRSPLSATIFSAKQHWSLASMQNCGSGGGWLSRRTRHSKLILYTIEALARRGLGT